jgi:hypothetical protein
LGQPLGQALVASEPLDHLHAGTTTVTSYTQDQSVQDQRTPEHGQITDTTPLPVMNRATGISASTTEQLTVFIGFQLGIDPVLLDVQLGQAKARPEGRQGDML